MAGWVESVAHDDFDVSPYSFWLYVYTHAHTCWLFFSPMRMFSYRRFVLADGGREIIWGVGGLG